MQSNTYWDEFAQAVVTRLIKPKPDDPFLIICDLASDISLGEACLSAGLRAGADTQLLLKQRYSPHAANKPGPVISEAILASKLILGLGFACAGVGRSEALIKARKQGTRVLSTNLRGIEDYAMRALLDIDYEAMIRNAELVAKLWENTNHCHVTSPQGTDINFNLNPRKSIIGDGALSEDGEIDYLPGAQVSIAPLEDTINGTIVIDASDSVQGIVHNPYSLTLTNGVITAISGDKEADRMRNWLKSRNDEKIYHLCHFSIGLNPQADISGNLIEDERKLTAVDFGFGYQDPSFGGTVGLSPYHMDIMLSTPNIFLDDKEMSGGGELNNEMGFEKM
jgi:leucyl aminopeptidase (aminopeptidase T)